MEKSYENICFLWYITSYELYHDSLDLASTAKRYYDLLLGLQQLIRIR